MNPDRENSEARRLAASRRARRRLEAIGLLPSLPAAEAVALAGRLLDDRRTSVQDAAAEALRTALGPQGRAELSNALDAPDEWRRLIAARSLAREQDPRARMVLETALKGCDLDQYGPAIEGLALFGANARETFERELLDEDNPRMLRELVAGALGALGEPAALSALMTAEAGDDRYVTRAARAARTALENA